MRMRYITKLGRLNGSHLSLLNTLSSRRLTVAASLDRADAHDSLVDGGFDAVVLLDVQLGHGVVLEGGRFLDISEGRGINDVSKGNKQRQVQEDQSRAQTSKEAKGLTRGA